MIDSEKWVPMIEACIESEHTYQQLYHRLSCGEVKARRGPGNRWFIPASEVARLKDEVQLARNGREEIAA